MEDGISGLLHHYCVGMLQGKQTFRLDVDKAILLWKCIF